MISICKKKKQKKGNKMALIKGKECEKEISSNVQVCPRLVLTYQLDLYIILFPHSANSKYIT